jgi:hypothetical protein
MNEHKKKVFFLAGILILSLGLALFVFIRVHQPPVRSRPLDSIADDDITKVLIQEPVDVIGLERRQNGWWLSPPVDDMADPETVQGLIGTLKGMTVGTLISENKNKYEGFGLTPANATHLQVYVKNATSPALDIFIGKQAVGYGSCYIHFAGKDPVYVADNLPSWLLIRPVDEFRKKTLLNGKPDAAEKLTFITEKSFLSLVRSSTTWTMVGTSTPVNPQITGPLFSSLESIRATGFADVSDLKSPKGFEKPVLIVRSETAETKQEFSVGAKKKEVKNQPILDQRYVQVKDRPSVLLVPAKDVDNLLTQLKTLPK